jgi:hypothetical protein
MRLRPLGFQALACFDQLFPLPVDRPLLFLFFGRHAHQRQRLTIALNEAVQLQTQRLGIQPVGFASSGWVAYLFLVRLRQEAAAKAIRVEEQAQKY